MSSKLKTPILLTFRKMFNIFLIEKKYKIDMHKILTQDGIFIFFRIPKYKMKKKKKPVHFPRAE